MSDLGTSDPARGSGHPVDVRIRSLTEEVRIVADDPALAGYLGFHAADPHMPDPEPVRRTFRIEGRGPRVAVEIGGMTLPCQGRPALTGESIEVARRLWQHLWLRILDDLKGAVLIHAAAIVAGSGRVLLVGSKGSGKTTLALRLLAEGRRIEGDEHVVLREKDTVTRPRHLHVRERSLRFAPELRDVVLAAPFLRDRNGDNVRSVPASVRGRPWEIAPSRIAHVVVIEPNHGGRSVLAPLTFERALPLVMTQTIDLTGNRLAAAVRLRAHILPARCWRLSLGDHGNAVRQLSKLIDGSPADPRDLSKSAIPGR